VRQVEQSPIGIWSGELDDETCDRIIVEGQLLEQEKATVYGDNLVDTTIRDNVVGWFPRDSWVDRLLFYYAHTTNELNNWNFNINDREQTQFTTYGEGDFYSWHRDCSIKSDTYRKLSITVQLSDTNDYSGGEFRLKDCWGNTDIDITERGSKRGTILVFPSFLLHKVDPIRSGIRYSLVQWYSGPPFT
tara:strand:+ start:983 stop:1549 length:567 start_codon:yes stop_codon:yes gene_type:complete